MKEKIKKILLWIALIISAIYFVSAFVDLIVNILLLNLNLIVLSRGFLGIAIFGWLIIKLEKKLNLPDLFKRKK